MTDQERSDILTSMEALELGAEATFPGAPSNPYRLTVYRYDYATKAIDCAACGSGCGVPWAGWFACENCPAIAFIATGQVFLPAVQTSRSAVAPRWDNPKRDPYAECGWTP